MNAETASRPGDLPAWLAYLETLHPKSIAMGLQRVRSVLDRMQVAIDVPVVTVTGTNGKGSTCAMLDSMLRCAGFSVGLYTSPHLLRYNERVVIDGHRLGALLRTERGIPTDLRYELVTVPAADERLIPA